MGSNSPAGRLTYKQLVRHVVGLNAAPGQAIKLQPEDMIDHGDFVADQVACADRISAIYLGYFSRRDISAVSKAITPAPRRGRREQEIASRRFISAIDLGDLSRLFISAIYRIACAASKSARTSRSSTNLVIGSV